MDRISVGTDFISALSHESNDWADMESDWEDNPDLWNLNDKTRYSN